MIITSKCPHCGAQVTFSEKDKAIICKYCDSVISIHDVDNSTAFQSNNVILKEVKPELRYVLSEDVKLGDKHYGNGGELWITDKEILVKPLKFFGSITDSYMSLEEITGYGVFPGAITEKCLMICGHDENGAKSFEIGVFIGQANDILNNIEFYRRQIFISKGEKPQEVTGFDMPTPTGIIYPGKEMQWLTKFLGNNGKQKIVTFCILFVLITVIIMALSE